MNQLLPTQNITNPGTYQTFQQNQQVINLGDGKQYNVVQQVPGKGVTLMDPTTNQQVMVSEQDASKLKPALKTSSFSAEDIVRSIVAELTGEELPKVVVDIKKEARITKAHTMNKNWSEARKKLKTRSQMNQKEIKEQPTYNEPRQDRAIRELTQTGFLKESKYKPYEGDLIKEVGRDKKTGLPMRGGDDIEVGLTEFPKDVEKADDPTGYGKYTMEQMDINFENDRPHFHNEQLLPDNVKKREESEDWYGGDERLKRIKELRAKDPHPRYSFPESDAYQGNPKEAALDEALDNAVGIKKKLAADEITPPVTEKLPIQYKEVQKAPKLEEYVEPNVLETANPDVKAAIEMFKDTQKKIADIKTQIDEKTKPLQQAILDATKELNTELAKEAALLKTSLDMIYDELKKTGDKVAVLNDEIFAAIEREKPVAPSATLPQILKKAEQINPQIAEEINKIKATIESDNTKMVLEQFLYKYPVSEVQKKKIKAALESGNLEQFLTEVNQIVTELQELNSTL